MSNEVEIVVTGKDRSQAAFSGAVNNMKAVSREIEQTTAKIKELQLQRAKGGNDSLFGDLKKEEAHLKDLKKLMFSFADDAGQVGTQIGKSVLGGMSSSFSIPALGPILMGSLIAVGVASAPLIGAAVGGAVVGGVGLGGIAGGIFAASRDPAVAQAATSFGDTVSKKFFGSGQALVQPIVMSLHDLDKVVHGLDLEGLFAKGAPAVQILADGVGKLVTNLMPGLNSVMNHSSEIAAIFSGGLADIGDAASGMLTDIINSKGTLEGLKFTLLVVADVIRITGKAVAFLGNTFQAETLAIQPFVDLTQGMLGWVPVLGDYINAMAANIEAVNGTADTSTGVIHGMTDAEKAAAVATKELGGTTKDAAIAINDLASAVNNANNGINAMISNDLALDKAHDKIAKDLKDATKLFDGNGGAIKGNSDAALANRDAIYGLTADYENLAAKMHDQGQSIDGLRAKFYEQLRALGLSDSEANKYADSILHVTSMLNSVPTDIHGRLDIDTWQAIQNINAVNRALDAVAYKTAIASGTLTQYDSWTHTAHASGGITGAASGGIRGNMTLVGEQGPELVKLPVGSNVYPAGTTQAMLSAAARERAIPANQADSSGGDNYYFNMTIDPTKFKTIEDLMAWVDNLKNNRRRKLVSA